MTYTTPLPRGALVSMTPTGGSTITFDTGRTGMRALSWDATPPYAPIGSSVDPYDLNQAVLAPFADGFVTWRVIVSCGGSGDPYGPPSTKYVQDVSDALLLAFRQTQQCTLVAYRLGYGTTVSNSDCRLVKFEENDDVVTHLDVNLTFTVRGLWS